MRPYSLLLIFLLAACSTPGNLSAITPSHEASRTPAAVFFTPTTEPTNTPGVPTIAPTATQTASATSTPVPPLSPDGPHLLLNSTGYSQPDTLTLLDVDGRGQKQLKLPAGGEAHNLPASVSPDGQWLAFYTGSFEAPYDKALNLMNIWDGTVLQVCPILSPKYSSNGVFPSGSPALTWSPKGRYLAFAAQIDGPSSDLYLYDIKTGKIRRLTEEVDDVSSINWSPDGSLILQEGTLFEENAVYPIHSLYVIDPFSYGLQPHHSLINSLFWAAGEWLSDRNIILSAGGDGCCQNNLRSLNVNSGYQFKLWPYVFSTYAIDLKNEVLAVGNWNFTVFPPEAQAGAYFVKFNGSRKKVFDEEVYRLWFTGGKDSQFVALTKKGIWSIPQAGSNTFLSDQWRPGQDDSVSARLIPSPDEHWFVVHDDNLFGLFSDTNQLVQTFDDLHAEEVIWRPDSSGLFVNKGLDLYYLPVPGGQPKLVYSCPVSGCEYDSRNATWVP